MRRQFYKQQIGLRIKLEFRIDNVQADTCIPRLMTQRSQRHCPGLGKGERSAGRLHTAVGGLKRGHRLLYSGSSPEAYLMET